MLIFLDDYSYGLSYFIAVFILLQSVRTPAVNKINAARNIYCMIYCILFYFTCADGFRLPCSPGGLYSWTGVRTYLLRWTVSAVC